MSPVLIVELAGIPVPKGRPKFTRTGITYTPARTRANEAALKYAAQVAMGDKAPLEGPIAVSITAVFPVPTSWSKRKQHAALMGKVQHVIAPDCDNLLKSCDALNSVCWIDDKQIVRAEIIKMYGTKPRMTIEIKQLDGGAAPDKS